MQKFNVDVAKLKREWPHLRSLPLNPNGELKPVMLISSDNIDLVSPLSYRLGPTGAPRGVRTLFGWTVQGKLSPYSRQINSRTLMQDANLKCLYTQCVPTDFDKLNQSVERLLKMESLSSLTEREATRSRLDKRAIAKLERDTDREEVDGISRYRTPLLWAKDDVKLYSEPRSVIPRLRALERKCTREP